MRKYQYPFTNSIVFALVMQDSTLCRGLLQTLFPERRIRQVKPSEEFIDTEHTIIAGIESRKVRLDVLFDDSDAWYDIEMQVRDEHDLPKRGRYAHAALDVKKLKSGDDYNELRPSYVIYLCCFDFFHLGEAVYQFQMWDPRKNLPLGDESYTMILNSRSVDPSAPKPLQELFQYMNAIIIPKDNELIQQIDRSVESWNTGEKVNLIMTLEQEILIKESRARKEGNLQGRMDTLLELVLEGSLSIDTAANKADMTVTDFQALLEQFDKNDPAKLSE